MHFTWQKVRLKIFLFIYTEDSIKKTSFQTELLKAKFSVENKSGTFFSFFWYIHFLVFLVSTFLAHYLSVTILKILKTKFSITFILTTFYIFNNKCSASF